MPIKKRRSNWSHSQVFYILLALRNMLAFMPYDFSQFTYRPESKADKVVAASLARALELIKRTYVQESEKNK
jgi:hypothetical protein